MRTSFTFFHGSKDALPGTGVRECGEAARFKELSEVPGWRRVLSNFHEEPIRFEGLTYQTVEHAFQARRVRLSNPAKAREFALESGLPLSVAGGMAARREGRKTKLKKTQNADWETMSKVVMEQLWELKFGQPGQCQEVLLRTGDAELWHEMPKTPRERWNKLEELRSKIAKPNRVPI